jgi:hypothetical protein
MTRKILVVDDDPLIRNVIRSASNRGRLGDMWRGGDWIGGDRESRRIKSRRRDFGPAHACDEWAYGGGARFQNRPSFQF